MFTYYYLLLFLLKSINVGMRSILVLVILTNFIAIIRTFDVILIIYLYLFTFERNNTVLFCKGSSIESKRKKKLTKRR